LVLAAAAGYSFTVDSIYRDVTIEDDDASNGREPKS
jgi:hypothetical protein